MDLPKSPPLSKSEKLALKKERKQRSKDIKSAIKSKRKGINFLQEEDNEKGLQINLSKPVSFTGRRLKTKSEEESDSDEPVEIPIEHELNDEPTSSKFLVQSVCRETQSDSEMETFDTSLLQTELLDFVDTEDEYTQPDNVQHPCMIKFQDGILYRKLDCNSLLVSINPGIPLYFMGKCAVKMLKGVVEICGYQMSPNEPKRYVFSPKGHNSLMSIKGVSREANQESTSVLEETMKEIPETVSAEEIMNLPGSAFIMQGFENEWCEGVRNYCTDGESLFGPSLTGMGPGEAPPLKSFLKKIGFQFIPQSMLQKSRLFEVSPAWNDAFNSILTEVGPNKARVMALGGKGVGKSTLTRWLVNKFLSYENIGPKSVLYIDLDPGQAEFTPPGIVSVFLCQEPLLGPNFTHLGQPLKSIFLGSLSVSDCPKTYGNSIYRLREFLKNKEEFTRIPWIVNTMGFSKGLGIEFAFESINVFHPTSVLQITIDNERRSYPFDLDFDRARCYRSRLRRSASLANMDQIPIENYQFFKIVSVCNERNSNKNPWGLSPKDLRDNVLASYFSEIIGLTKDANFLAVVPYSVRLDSVAVGTMRSNLSYDNILRAINGNLVALNEFPLDSLSYMQRSGSTETSRKYITNGDLVPSTFYGYGIVRAIDYNEGVLHIVTPVSTNILKSKVNTIIAAGAIGLPISFYLNSSSNDNKTGTNVPYVMGGEKTVSKLHTAVTRQFVPRRVTHNVLKNCLL